MRHRTRPRTADGRYQTHPRRRSARTGGSCPVFYERVGAGQAGGCLPSDNVGWRVGVRAGTRLEELKVTAMLSSTMAPAPTRLDEDAVAGRVPQSANDLIHALAGTPADDPGRPALRARVIEQWMPL